MELDVGQRLRQVRKARNLSQRELATRAGVTNGMISMIENNTTSPSIGSLKKVLSVFGMSLAEFFSEDAGDADRFVFRRGEFVEINPSSVFSAADVDGLKALSLKSFGRRGDSNLLMLYETYENGADTGPDPYAHEGEECGIVIEGELLLTVGEKTESLKQGDAYHFVSTLPHRFRNVSDRRCIVISACTPPSF